MSDTTAWDKALDIALALQDAYDIDALYSRDSKSPDALPNEETE